MGECQILRSRQVSVQPPTHSPPTPPRFHPRARQMLNPLEGLASDQWYSGLQATAPPFRFPSPRIAAQVPVPKVCRRHHRPPHRCSRTSNVSHGGRCLGVTLPRESGQLSPTPPRDTPSPSFSSLPPTSGPLPAAQAVAPGWSVHRISPSSTLDSGRTDAMCTYLGGPGELRWPPNKFPAPSAVPP